MIALAFVVAFGCTLGLLSSLISFYIHVHTCFFPQKRGHPKGTYRRTSVRKGSRIVLVKGLAEILYRLRVYKDLIALAPGSSAGPF